MSEVSRDSSAMLAWREVTSESNEWFMKCHYKKKQSNMHVILSETQQNTLSKLCWNHEVWESAIVQISEWVTFFEQDQANYTNFRSMKQDVLSRTDEVHRHATCFELCSAELIVENELIFRESIIQEEFTEFLAENWWSRKRRILWWSTRAMRIRTERNSLLKEKILQNQRKNVRQMWI